MPCYLCNAIQQNVRGVLGSDHLVQAGPAEVLAHGEAPPATVTHYKCSECGCKWRYADDPNDPLAGWQFVRRDR